MIKFDAMNSNHEIFVFGFVLSSIFNLFAFYFKLEFFQYSNRIFHVLTLATLATLAIYTVSNLKENKVLIDEELFI